MSPNRLITPCLLALLGLIPAARPAEESPDWENPAVFERGQVEPHATLMPFESVEAALEGDRKASPWCHLLSGTWKFHWAPAPGEAPTAFFGEDFDASDWDDIEVPSSWQMQGFGHPMFRNIEHPFPSDPPRVPADYNPVGSYRRSFDLPRGWEGRRVFLHFEGVKSASYVWVNGKRVGYNEGGMEPAEYDVTSVLRSGENSIAVQVYRFSDGTYLEDQDMWRLSGIYRDVYLMATPRVHVRDFFVTTDLDEDYRDARLEITAEVEHHGGEEVDGYRLRATLYAAEEASAVADPFESDELTVPPSGTTRVRLAAVVESPRLWSAEHPHLYRLTLELLGPGGEAVEILGTRVGFREVEIRDGALLVNGRSVKLNAVNSHVHHPDTGRTMDVETMREDLVLMKRFNVNAVRTSHYPPNPEYLDLADALGVYVIDEAGTEAHATEFLSERPEWRAAYVDRGRKMVHRDRNHPSVVIWSAGNESGSGDNICAIIGEGKRLDPTRPWLYGGNNDYFPSNAPLDCEEIVGPRYPIPFELKTWIGRVPASVDPRPSFMDEYAAATGNSLGALDEYWEVIRAHRRTIGGAVWDWVSPGIRWRWRFTADASPHRNDGVLMGRAGLVEGRRGGGQALALSGHDEWLELYRDPSLDVTGDQLTLAMWVFPRRWNGHGPLLTKGDHQYGLQQTAADALEFFVHDRQRISVTAPTPEGWEGRWHHLAGIYDGSALRLLVDGVVVASREHWGTIDHNPFPVNVGRNAALHGQEHAGELSNALVDDVRIFARALGDGELDADSADLRREARLWLDFESVEDEGEFFSLGIGGRSYGVVWPDRVPQPELWQLKKSAQPVAIEAVDLEKGLLRVTNHHHFTDLSELEASWRLTADGEVQEEGPLEIALPPGESTTIRVPAEIPEEVPGVEAGVEVRFTLPRETPWAPRGHEVAWEQFLLPVPPPPPGPVDGLPPLRVDEEEGRVVIRGEGFTCSFDETRGTLSSMTVDGVELLQEGPRANVWRAPLANERDAWGLFRGRLSTHREGMGNDIANGWRAVGLDRLEHVVESLRTTSVSDREVLVQIRAHAVPPELPPRSFSTGFDLEYEYRVRASGDILLRHSITPRGRQPDWLPKVGLQMVLAEEFDRLTWHGRGPFETYPDRRSGARIGVYEGTVAEQYVPYLVPQDYGNKSDVRWVSVANAGGVGLLAVGEERLEVSAQHFATENLSRAWYPFQLLPQGGVTLNLDHRVSGVGGTAVSVLKEFQTFPQPYEYRVRLRPYRSGEAPRELARQGFW